MGLICISAAAATRQRSTSAGLSFWVLLLWLLALPFAGSAAAGTGPGTELRIVPGLEEPLVARVQASAEEAAALTTAIEAFQSYAGAGDDLAALNVFEHFLQQYPDSVWRVALQTDLGLAYYQHGYFSKAITAFEQAWQAGQNEESPLLRALTDRAAGELARMHARLGHAEALAGLLDVLDGRPVSGPATEALAGAKEGLWAMRHDPGVAYLCGPMALKNLLLSQRPDTRPGQFLDDFRSGPNGVSLAEVARLADQAGFLQRGQCLEPSGQRLQPVQVRHHQLPVATLKACPLSGTAKMQVMRVHGSGYGGQMCRYQCPRSGETPKPFTDEPSPHYQSSPPTRRIVSTWNGVLTDHHR